MPRPLSNCQALVVDMTHGGEEICRELLRRNATVYALDNHKTLRKERIKKLEGMGVKVFTNEEELLSNMEGFDVIIVQHASPRMRIFSKAMELGIPVITHARAVGIILSEEKEKNGMKTVEITGTNGKTTVANMLTKILTDEDYKVLVHDSVSTRVVESSEEKVLFEGMSITPANILRAYRAAVESELHIDFAIFEVSLGGTGACDVGIVTGIYENYAVSFLGSAFNSKLQMAINMRDGVLVLNGDNDPTRRFVHVFYGRSNIYGIRNGREVLVKNLKNRRVIGEIRSLHTLSGKELSGDFSFELDRALFGRFQIVNALGALTAALSLGADVENSCRSLGKFRGVKGRAIAKFMEKGILVDCCNRGVNIPAIIQAIEEAEIMKAAGEVDSLVVVISGSERAACEIIDVKKLSKELEAKEIDKIVLSGPLGKRLMEAGLKGEFVDKVGEDWISNYIAKHGNPIILFFNNEA
ncbi:MAG: coenzyme F430 synthase [Thermoproteota archaeon]|uniref:Coenzyme F430 synthase n=1 Tax=Candidatus Methanodesulfokora washburnensis TaxID=2478471 RepID=A0A3R9QTG7_9CREN|nr:coenzyme F430 synthase [Candidatus Methanodesulfokores washburnensis]RSN72823.1 coenzyme F430 synthase [Candidatus Methanodesulfokores washburnensis]RZN63759.1 MAG: coenzyme F430 synthase [Candidatus Methanodesulfokores washburnensis]TDA40894.1 MAG: coenzyme F430 synthase [Candidatus Korarchaeota archaeon]